MFFEQTKIADMMRICAQSCFFYYNVTRGEYYEDQ